MAKDATNTINYYLAIDEPKQDDVAVLRTWNNLKVGLESNIIWIKDFDDIQINSLEVKSIPYKTIYYEKNGKLHVVSSILPDRTIPKLLWTPIGRYFQVTLPTFNHNFFGISETIPIKLMPCEEEREAEVLVTSIKVLHHYMETAPSIRLKNLRWTILNHDKACIIGKPLLPINGAAYWKTGQTLIPTGYHFEFPLLTDEIDAIVNPHKNAFIIWSIDSSYALMETHQFEPLSISSFRLSFIKHSLR